jgi:hypothetical protein
MRRRLVDWFCGRTFWPCTGVAILGAVAFPVCFVIIVYGVVKLIFGT